MKITKIYESIINISAIDMYTKGVDNTVLGILNNRYLGKCEKNSLITKIIGIEKMSECRLNKSLLDGSGQVSVQFRAEAIVYNEGDILTGCKILKIDKGNKIICEYENAYVNIKGNRNLQSLHVGQKLTIKVNTVSYLKGTTKITINGVPYSYSYIFTVYKTNLNKTQITTENLEIINDKIKEIEDEIKLIKDVDQKIYQTINQIYYPFTQVVSSKLKTINILNFRDINKVIEQLHSIKNEKKKEEDNEVYLIRHPIIDKSTPDVFVLFNEPTNDNQLFNPKIFEYKVIEENCVFVILYFLNDYLNHIRAIKEMSILFKKESDFESHNNIWEIYGRLKLKFKPEE